MRRLALLLAVWLPVGWLTASTSVLRAQAACTFRVSVPRSTPAGATVYVAGDFQGWNPGSPAHALAPLGDGRWTITLPLAAGQAVQFKFTRGTWETVEKGYDGEEIANRSLTVSDGATYDLSVLSWRDLGTVTGDVESFTYAPFLGGRRCWVYLPRGYDGGTARYPVLLMQDGQNLFDVRTSFAGEWHVDETCDSLVARGEIEPLIVVGVENGGGSRCDEYTPWFDPGVGCGGGADAYLAAVRDVLLPEINGRYRTDGGAGRQYLSGSSLGGLLSTYAGYAFDATFSRVAALSPSYWWDGEHLRAWSAGRPKPALARFYQDMGTIESGFFVDGDGNGVDDSIDELRRMRDVALAQGFVAGSDFLSVEANGHTHTEYFWALRLPDVLRFLIDAPVTAAAGPLAHEPAARLRVWRKAPTRWLVELRAPAGASCDADIFDLTGRRVARLWHGVLPTPTHVVEWQQRDDRGRRVAPGIYLVRMGSAADVQGQRVVVF